MKLLLVLALTVLTTVSAHAAKKGYVCTILDPQAQRVIGAQNLPGFLREIGILTVSPASCGKPAVGIYSDFCVVNGTVIAIGLHADESIIKLRSGKQYQVICEQDVEVNPNPSHGGSH